MHLSYYLAWQFKSTLVYINSSLNPFIYYWKIREVKLAVKGDSSVDGAVSLLWSTVLFSYKFIPNQNLLYEKILPEKKSTVLLESFFIQTNIAIHKAHILQ